MCYPPSYLWYFLLQVSIFVYYFYSGVNFCGKTFAVILFCGNLFLRIAKKTAKIAKIRTCKNLVPHGISPRVLEVIVDPRSHVLSNCLIDFFYRKRNSLLETTYFLQEF